MKKKRKSKLEQSKLLAVFAVLLTAVAPILALHNFNVKYMHYSAVLRSLWFAALFATGILLVLWAILRDLNKAAAVTGLFLLFFLLYGHVYQLLSGWRSIPNLLLSSLWVVLFLVGVWLLLRRPSAVEQFNRVLLLGTALLTVYNLANILLFENAKQRTNQASLQQADAQQAGTLAAGALLPDIYYIILDAHTRPDRLLERFDYDAAPFVQALEDMGFHVAACSQANYWRTEFSVGSALRMDYFGPEFEEADTLPDWAFSAVIQSVKQLGYQVVTFETRATHNQEIGQDVLLSRPPQNTLYENLAPLATLNDFEANLIKTTWLHSWLQLIGNYRRLLPQGMVLDPESAVHLEHYQQTYYILDELPRVAYMTSPKFVYVHLLVPHEPFIFDASGSYVFRDTQEEFVEGYRNNVEFIDAHILTAIQGVLANSAKPPIIVLQGDHGPNGSQPELLLPILNAYYLPNGGDAALYDHISPINTFRTLFSYYFGADYERLPDLSYYGRGTNLNEGVLIENFCD